MAEDMTYIYLRGENEDEYKRIGFVGASLTMASLIDDFGVTSVVECSDDGEPLSRGLAIHSPTSKLHKGGHYTIREHDEEKKRGVLFDSKINVTEYRPSAACVPSRSQSQSQQRAKVGAPQLQPSATSSSSTTRGGQNQQPVVPGHHQGGGEFTSIRPYRIRVNEDERILTGPELQSLLDSDPMAALRSYTAQVDGAHALAKTHLSAQEELEQDPTATSPPSLSGVHHQVEQLLSE